MQREKEMEKLPNDLMVEIFSRLPSKSVARFCTLSKHWASTFHSQEFAERFLARSSARPRLLFAVDQYSYNRWQIFSTPQPQNQYEQSSHVDFHTKFSPDVSRYICSYSSGLLYFPNVRFSEEEKAPLICNPVTGLYVRLPSLVRYRKSRGFLGFDPIDKQFKVMSEAYPFSRFEHNYGDDHHNILTLGSEELTWRSNNTTRYDCSLTEGICINGFLYYLARTFDGENPVMVCFDLKSEEFKFINAECFSDQLEYDHRPELSLVNYKGKLGGIYWKRVDGGIVELCVWVLEEDVEKTEWVNYVYILPENEVLRSCEFSVSGVTATGDIVLAMKFICEPYYVFYFNPERNTLQSVEIKGFGSDFGTAKTRGQVYAFVDHVEDLSVNNSKQLKSILSHVKHICSCWKGKSQLQSHLEEELNQAIYAKMLFISLFYS